MTEEQGRTVLSKARTISQAHGVPVSGVMLLLGNVRKEVSVTCAPGHLRRVTGLRRYLPTGQKQIAFRRACESLSAFVDKMEAR
jgi:hypothetical protein